MRRLLTVLASAAAAGVLVPLGVSSAQAADCSADPAVTDGHYIAVYVDGDDSDAFVYFDNKGWGRFERDDSGCDAGGDGQYSPRNLL